MTGWTPDELTVLADASSLRLTAGDGPDRADAIDAAYRLRASTSLELTRRIATSAPTHAMSAAEAMNATDCQASDRVSTAGCTSPFDPHLHQAQCDHTGRRRQNPDRRIGDNRIAGQAKLHEPSCEQPADHARPVDHHRRREHQQDLVRTDQVT
jgi:hypothetical protein